MTHPTPPPDITGRDDLIVIVDAFYTKVRRDPRLAPVFDDIAQVDWESHLPKLYDFWDTVLFRAGTFRGNPMAAHANLVARAGIDWPLFERWLELFRETVHEHYQGDRAGHLIRCAEDMAKVIHGKIHATPEADVARERLTPEQRARYRAYRD